MRGWHEPTAETASDIPGYRGHGPATHFRDDFAVGRLAARRELVAGCIGEHAAEARAALNAIVADPEHGVQVLSSPKTMSNLLKDLLADAPREKSLLVAAAEAGLADTLREHMSEGMDPSTAIQLTASSFSARSPMTPEACRWVTSEIAAAMGITSPGDLGSGAGQNDGGRTAVGYSGAAPTRGHAYPPAQPVSASAHGSGRAAPGSLSQAGVQGFGQAGGQGFGSGRRSGLRADERAEFRAGWRSGLGAGGRRTLHVGRWSGIRAAGKPERRAARRSRVPANPEPCVRPAATSKQSAELCTRPGCRFKQPVGYPQPGYQPGVPAWSGEPGYTGQKTNGLAVAALVCGIVQFFGFWLLGTIPAIILGHMARNQIRHRNEQGAGLALAGIILGYAGIALTVIFVLIIIAAVHRSTPSTGY